jgi:hypothetical protein
VTEQLHRLIDSGAKQPVINERVAGLIESANKDLREVLKVTVDHERRIGVVERRMYTALGAIGAIATLTSIVFALITLVLKK